MGIFNKKQKIEDVEPEPKVAIESLDTDKEQDKRLIIQSLMEDPEVKAYLAITRGAEKFRIATELQNDK